MAEKCRAKGISYLMLFVTVFFLLNSGENVAELHEQTPVDYVIVLDTSQTMYEPILLTPSEFFECESEPGYVTKEGEARALWNDARSNIGLNVEKFYARRITIARGALECFFERFGKKGDRVALLLIGDSGIESATNGFCDYSKWSEILELIEREENKSSGSTYSPLGDALWEAVNLFRHESAGNSRNIMLFISDLRETPPEKGRLICDVAKEIHTIYGREIWFESLFFLCIATEREDYNDKSNCFQEYLPYSLMIPVSMERGFELTVMERIIDLEIYTRGLSRELDDKKGKIMVLESRVEEYQELSNQKTNGLEDLLKVLRYPLVFILFISGIGIFWGVKIIFYHN